jgi:hypothetical protein
LAGGDSGDLGRKRERDNIGSERQEFGDVVRGDGDFVPAGQLGGPLAAPRGYPDHLNPCLAKPTRKMYSVAETEAGDRDAKRPRRA